MSYTDTVRTHIFQLKSGLPADFDTMATAGVFALQGRAADVGTAASASLDCVYCPSGGQIEEVGVVLTEAISAFVSARAVVKVQYCSIQGATAAAAVTLTIPTASDVLVQPGTAAAPGTIYPTGRTATQACAIGARIVAPDLTTVANVATAGSKVLPFALAPGSNFYLEATTNSDSTTGAGHFYVVVRHNGARVINSASPTTKAYSLS